MLTLVYTVFTYLGLMCRKVNVNMLKYLWPAKKHMEIPGPKGWPIVGNLFSVNFTKFQHELTRFSKTYGPMFKLNILGTKVVTISDPGLLRKAFGTEAFGYHLNDRGINSSQHVFFGRKHIGFADLNKETIALRNILRRETQMYSINEDNFENVTQIAIDRLMRRITSRDSKDYTNPDNIIKDFLTDLNSTFLIGEALPEDDEDQDALWELIDLLYTLIDPSIDRPLKMFPFLRHLPGKHGRIFRASIKARDRVSKRYFDTSKATFQEGRVRGLVDVCLQMQADDIREKGECWLSDDYIKGIMYDTVVAGMTEMMKSLRMLILLVCHHQDVQSRVQQEIHDVIRDDKPTCSHRKEMPYTQAVIYEMLRYVSQTPLAIPHKCNKDIILDGYLIEKNTGIVPNIWGIHHDDDVWGDSWVFRPERFLDENKQLIPSDHKLMKSFIPFSVGKRRCPGENFAMSRTFLVFVSLLQQLHFAPPEDQELPSVDPRLYTNKYPLHLPVFSCTATSRPEENTT